MIEVESIIDLSVKYDNYIYTFSETFEENKAYYVDDFFSSDLIYSEIFFDTNLLRNKDSERDYPDAPIILLDSLNVNPLTGFETDNFNFEFVYRSYKNRSPDSLSIEFYNLEGSLINADLKK